MSKEVEGEDITSGSTNGKGKIKMTYEENDAVREVKVVLEVEVKKYVDTKNDIPYELMQNVIERFQYFEEDYNRTKKELLLSNSSVVKLEKLIELIGIVGTISVENEDCLDKILEVLTNQINSIKS